jgi:hypothetical protein
LKRVISFLRRARLPLLVSLIMFLPICAYAQASQEADPSAALVSALTAACKHDETQFANYLTNDNATAFRALPLDQRSAILKRFSLTDDAGRPLLSTDQNGRSVLRCQVASATAEFRFGAARAEENLAFIPLQTVDGETSDIGMVRESGGWKIISVGLMVFDIHQLSGRWKEQETENREDDAIHSMRDLQTVIGTYQRAFDKLPESLQQLGPAPKNQVSPEQANLIGAQLVSGTQNGYRFRYRIVTGADGNPSGFEITATPETYGKSGKRSFFLDAAGKFHGADKHGESATPEDPILPEEDTQN